jgi:hypothetical protein
MNHEPPTSTTTHHPLWPANRKQVEEDETCGTKTVPQKTLNCHETTGANQMTLEEAENIYNYRTGLLSKQETQRLLKLIQKLEKKEHQSEKIKGD